MQINEIEEKLKSINSHLYVVYDEGFESIDYVDKDDIHLTVYSFVTHRYYLYILVSCLSSDEFNQVVELINHIEHPEADNPFKKYTDKLAETLQAKNNAYGDSFTKSVNKYGLSVIGVRLSDKYNRIEHLITNEEFKENDESLEDTLLDNAGYSILALKYLEEQKYETSKSKS